MGRLCVDGFARTLLASASSSSSASAKGGASASAIASSIAKGNVKAISEAIAEANKGEHARPCAYCCSGKLGRDLE